MPAGIAQTCVTSPPYWGLRDYGADGQIGLEDSPDAYVERIVEVFRSVRRVLRDDGTLWLNLGDSYTPTGNLNAHGGQRKDRDQSALGFDRSNLRTTTKPKDLVGIPWRVAFALRADGWYLRSDIIWHKPNPMPESVTDRPTKSHEYLFLLSKSPHYYYDGDAIAEPSLGRGETKIRFGGSKYGDSDDPKHATKSGNTYTDIGTRNARTVWTIPTKPYAEAHFATFPVDLPARCIRAGSRLGDTVLDPFMGSGTTAWVARHHGRNAIGCEINPDYLKIAAVRLQQLSLLDAGAPQSTTTGTSDAPAE
jgi:DNA modification methylase